MSVENGIKLIKQKCNYILKQENGLNKNLKWGKVVMFRCRFVETILECAPKWNCSQERWRNSLIKMSIKVDGEIGSAFFTLELTKIITISKTSCVFRRIWQCFAAHPYF